MSNNFNNLREFDKFRLNLEKQVLWCENEIVNLPPKAIEVLCVLVERNGEVLSKKELIEMVWRDSFVEESNLTHQIYELRKVFKELGCQEDFIQTVSRRGYRWTSEVVHISDSPILIIEKHSDSQILIEEIENSIEPNKKALPLITTYRLWMPIFAGLILILSVFGYYLYNQKPNKTGEIKSIAILPLKSFDANANDEQLRLQITDSLITKFGNLKEIAVRPTSSVVEYTKSNESSLEIGKKLQVDAVLDGTIQQEGENIRINFQLISIKNGTQIWSEQFNGKAHEFLHFQDVISAKLLTKMSLPMSANQLKVFEKRPTENFKAYEEYLQGRYFWSAKNLPRGEKLAAARKFFEKAIELDPNFALAYANLSTVVSMQSTGEFIPRKEGLELTKMLAVKSYELDPNLAETNAALGFAMQTELDQTNAEKLLLRAIELNPNYTTSYQWLSFIYLNRGDYEKEIEILLAGRRIDPTNYSLVSEQVVAYQAANRCDKSLELLPEAIMLNGGNADGKNNLEAVTYSVCGKNEEALPILERIWKEQETKHPSSSLLSQLGYSHAKLGNREKALEFAKMIEDKKDSFVYEKATPIYLALGEKEKMFQLLEEMTVKVPYRWSKLRYDLRLDSLKTEPRFQALLKKMNQ